ncbi:MAG TPA: phage holin family protein [Steroidobacteraceae bacterium]|nr:phage holin family protein [Steroidobacteraceae bacterium]
MTDDAASPDSHSTAGPIAGLLHSLAQLAATLLSMVHTRIELVTTELQEQARHVITVLLWSLLALLMLGMGCLFAALLVIIVYWDTHRLLAAICVTASFFVIAAVAALTVFIKLRTHPKLLQATLDELKRDQELLRARR